MKRRTPFNKLKSRKNTSRNKLYLWGLGFFLIAIALATALGLYVFSRPSASFTGERVKFEMTPVAPAKPGASEEYTLLITNNEEVDLEEVELFIGWTGARGDKNGRVDSLTAVSGKPISGNNIWAIQNIPAGETREFAFEAIFAGEAAEVINLPFRLSVKPRGFSGKYNLDWSKEIIFGAPVFGLEIQGPDSASAGSEVALFFTVSRLDASAYEANDLSLSLVWPPDSLIASEPASTNSDAGIWKLSDLGSSGDSYVLTARFTMPKEAGAVFAVSASLFTNKNRAVFVHSQKLVTIAGSDTALSLSARPAQGEKLQWGEDLAWKATLKNTSQYVSRDNSLSVSISGEDLWRSGSLVIEEGGFYEAGNIIWDARTTPELDSLLPGAAIDLGFRITARSEPPPFFSGPPAFLAKARSRGNLGDQATQAASGEVLVKILANAEFSVQASPNGEITEIIWRVGPTNGALSDLLAQAKLGPGVEWLEDTALSVGELSYDSSSRLVSWRASQVPKLSSPVNIKFSVRPGSGAVILERSELLAVDSAAKETMALYGGEVRR